MALLAALCDLRSCDCLGAGGRIVCMHVEHGIRPQEESGGDAEFVRSFCESRGIEYRIECIPPGKIAAFARRRGIGIEAAARHFRHRALLREAGKIDSQSKSDGQGGKTRILIAHTKDDALELALMRFLRGCGPAGLAAMPVNRERILRPLLNLTRAEVIAYLTEKKISWREDSTNTDEKYLRNRIRRRLVPLLNEAFPSWKSGVTALAETQSLAAAFLTEEAMSRVKWESEEDIDLSADEANFFAQPLIVREEALFLGIDAIKITGDKSVKRAVVRKFCEGSVSAADLGPVKVRREKGKILLSCVKKEFFECGVSRVC